ncbi:NAD(P)-dependent oxidoreductase [Lentisphaera marina]|uniref:NAD-dependent epimerase/dehydratase family protein n=1 Tax=Lentisphaera marina TaxID=1111041 RepID=UPI0023663B83|nr:NAD(P)-dependent oxidoreductase [Lentisphaera marina]MDD7986252.1 NAD(P)-dependent oxidoreductase [Lentisphaera marina]
MQVMIIGGSGCVGEETAKALLKRQKCKVIAVSRGKSAHKVIEGVIYEQGDILDKDSILRLLHKYEVTHVLHTAALRTSQCKTDPVQAVRVNINGTANVLEAVREYGKLEHFVFISTAAVYKVPSDGSFPDESSPTEALNLYTSTKLAGEELCESYAHSYGIKCTVLRPQIIYGPSRGEEGSTAGLSIAMKEAKAGNAYTIPFSGQYAFTYSGDVGKFCKEVISNKPVNDYELYNLPGESLEISEIVKQINLKCGRDLISSKEIIYPFAKGVSSNKFFEMFTQCRLSHFEDLLTQNYR